MEIQVICNDEEMSEELVSAYTAYGGWEELPFDVEIHQNLEKDQLRNVLESESDFTHYIGHIDEEGFRCTDGNLDAKSLECVKTKAFFLNACHSDQQGLELIKAGSVGGIVTNDEIQNDYAVNIGSTVARLLNLGYPLYAAVDIIRIKNPYGNQYHIVGDGRTSVAQSRTTIPNICLIDRDNSTKNNVHTMMNLYFPERNSKGCIFTPAIDSVPHYHYVPQQIGPFYANKSELIKFLDIEPIPVIIDGHMCWSDNISIKDI